MFSSARIETILTGLHEKFDDFGIYEEPGLVVISGTKSLSDWKINLDVDNVDGYHEGFLTTAKQAMTVIKQPAYVVVGFSLGAAVGSIMAELDDRCLYAVGLATPNYTTKKKKTNVTHIGCWFDPVMYLPFFYRKSGKIIRVWGYQHSSEYLLKTVSL
jgi:hypothetical protein